MSDVTTTDYNIDLESYTLQTITDYFGDIISLEAWHDMSSEERQIYLATKFQEFNCSVDTIELIHDAIEIELDDWALFLWEEWNDLDAIFKSDVILEVADAIAIENLMIEILGIQEMCDGEFMDDFDAAEDLFNDHNIVSEDNDWTAPNPSNPQDGDVYNIDATADEGNSTNIPDNPLNYDHPDYQDLNHDGLIENAEVDCIYDENGNLKDVDGNGVVNELDNPAYSDGTNGTVVDLSNTPEDAIVNFMDYAPDADPPSLRIKITLADGTFYYYNITGNPKIILPILPVNIDSIPEALAMILYSTATTEHSYGYSLYGHDYLSDVEYFTKVDMSDKDNEWSYNITDEDFENERVITVTFHALDADMFSLDGNDCDITFEEDGDGNLVIIFTNEEGKEVRVVCVGLEYSSDADICDAINIENATMTEDGFNFMSSYVISGGTANEPDMLGGLYGIITIDGDGLVDEAQEAGIVLDSYSISLANENNSYNIPADADIYTNNTAYTFHFTEGQPDVLDLNFPDDAVITFDTDESGNLIIRATTSEGTATFTIIGAQYSQNDLTATSDFEADRININGGDIEGSEDNYDVLAEVYCDNITSGESEQALWALMTYNGIPIWEHSVLEDGYAFFSWV